MHGSHLVGRQPIREALRAERPIEALYCLDNLRGQHVSEILQLAKEQSVPIKRVQRQKLDQLAEGRPHQGMAASCAAHAYADLDEVLDGLGASPLLLVLDHLQDPHNVGAILRTAEAVGVDAVLSPKRRAVGLTATVAKASAGAIEHIPVARIGNVGDALLLLKERGFWIYGLDGEADKDYTQSDYSGPVALVIGSEGKGLSARTRKSCDVLVKLPMLGRVESLNASVATAVCLYEVLRQRSQS